MQRHRTSSWEKLAKNNCETPLLEHSVLDLPVPVVLLKVRFSRTALRLDKYAQTQINECPIWGQFLQCAARLLSVITHHDTFDVTLTATGGESQERTECILSDAAYAQRCLLSGVSIDMYGSKTVVPTCIILLWTFSQRRNTQLLDVYTALKRAVPECRMTLAQSMVIPTLFAMHRQTVYFPSPGLITVQSSIL